MWEWRVVLSDCSAVGEMEFNRESNESKIGEARETVERFCQVAG